MKDHIFSFWNELNLKNIPEPYTNSTPRTITSFTFSSIKKPNDSHYLFTCDDHAILKQWNINRPKLVKKFGKIHPKPMVSMVSTSDGAYLFTSDVSGYIKQWDIKKSIIIKDYGKVHHGIRSMVITSDN